MDHLIPPRLCAWCRNPFTPTRKEQRYCPRPSHCSHFGAAQRLKGVVPQAACDAKRQRDQRIVAEACAGQFGDLTEREAAIYRFAEQHGYDRGYLVGYDCLPRKRTG